jgi:hypothetical protein
MRKTWMLALLVLVATVAFAGDKKDKFKDFRTGKIVKVNTADIQSADYAVTDNRTDPIGGAGQSAGGMGSGGSFSSAPTHYIRYQALIETDTELIQVSRDREASMTPPDLKVDTEIKWKPNGLKSVEVIDGRGKKFDMMVVKRFPKDAPPAPTGNPAGTAPTGK